MFGVRLSKMGSASKLGLIAKAIAILRKYGTDAHVYLPGIGTVNGLTAGNYLDSAGVTAASVDNPVGLSLDAIGLPIPISTTTFTAYQATATSTTLPSTATCTTSGAYGFQIPAVYTAGRVYEYTISWSGNTARRDLTVDGYAGVAVFSNAEYGTATFKLKQPGVDLGVYAMSATAGDSFTLISLSVREIPGIHATQGTTANKPILRRGLLNRFLRSQELSVSPWANGGTSPTITENAGLSASGAMTADRVKFPSGADSERYQNAALVSGQPFTIAAVVKSFSGSSEKFRFTANDFVSNSADLTATATYQTFVYNFNATSSSPTAAGLRADSLNSAGDLLVDSIGIFAGTYTAQQIIDAGGIPLTTSAAASNASAGKYSWQFDGSNDSLSLSAPLFQMSDDHCVIVGFNASAINKYVFSQNNTAASTLVASLRIDAAGAPNALWQDDAATLVNVASTTSCIGSNTVATAIKIGNAKRLRVNGVQQGATNNTVMGATTLNTASIGSYTTAGNLTGSIYPIIAIKGTVSDSDLLTLERAIGLLSGVSI